MTPEEYLVLEDAAAYRSEYYDGAMIAMTDRSIENATINVNLVCAFAKRLRHSPWTAFGSNMRVMIDAIPLYTYPDLSVILESPQLAAHSDTTLINPILIVEVMAPVGESYRRRATFQQFQKIATLEHYLVVAQEYPRVDYYWRWSASPLQEWRYLVYEGMEAVLRLPPMEIEMPLREIYERIEFPAPGTTPSHKHPDHDRIF